MGLRVKMEDRTVLKIRANPEIRYVVRIFGRKFVGSVRDRDLVSEQIKIRTMDRTNSKRPWASLLETFPANSKKLVFRVEHKNELFLWKSKRALKQWHQVDFDFFYFFWLNG